MCCDCEHEQEGADWLAAGAGDSACTIPPQSIPAQCLEVIRDWTPKLARALKVVGLINIQYCVQDNQVGARPPPAPVNSTARIDPQMLENVM